MDESDSSTNRNERCQQREALALTGSFIAATLAHLIVQYLCRLLTGDYVLAFLVGLFAALLALKATNRFLLGLK